ncbi:MAG: nucleotide-binding domain containing protein [Acidobacteriota bacterium]
MRERLGQQQGILLRELLLASGVRRVCVAGGDTSSHAISRLEFMRWSVNANGAGQLLNRAHATDARLDGLQIALKGGQHGRPNHFESIRAMRAAQ